MAFPVVMYGCDSWTMKRAECRRVDAFELWSWRRLLRVHWTARRSNKSILREISPECSLEWLMLKLKRQYFGHLMWRTDSFEKTLMLFDDPMDVGKLISGSSDFSKSSLTIWKFTVHVLLKPGLENFEHYFASVWDECNCVVVWAFFGIAFVWDWNENWPFAVCGHC